MKPERWFSITLLLAGIVLGGMVGSWNGKAEAHEVKQQIEERLDREVQYIRESIDELKDMVRDLQDR